MTQIVGILNITDDSFSDGGRYRSTESAIAHALALANAGAQYIELGPASSNPDASAVSEDEEIARIRPVIHALQQHNIRFGVDSHHPSVQFFASAQGAAFINDIRGFTAHQDLSPLAETKATLVIMHAMQDGGIADRVPHSFDAVWEHLIAFFSERIASMERAGIDRSRIVLDPGMGYFLSSDPNPSVQVLQRLPELRMMFGCELFVSVSRKSFIRQLAEVPVEHSAAATLAAELYSAQQGAHYIRTHDVAALRSALVLDTALRTSLLIDTK